MRASIRPPARPRTPLRKSCRTRRLATFIRWVREMSWAVAASSTVTSRSGCAAAKTSSLSAYSLNWVRRMDAARGSRVGSRHDLEGAPSDNPVRGAVSPLAQGTSLLEHDAAHLRRLNTAIRFRAHQQILYLGHFRPALQREQPSNRAAPRSGRASSSPRIQGRPATSTARRYAAARPGHARAPSRSAPRYR